MKEGSGIGFLIVILIGGYFYIKSKLHSRKMRKLEDWYNDFKTDKEQHNDR